MKLFISYRRTDSSYVTDRLYDYIAAYVDKQNIFRDINSITPGADFRRLIERAIEQCSVVLVVIGSRWLTPIDSSGRRRLDGEDDYVRIEVETALRRQIPVIPLLIEDVGMPSRTDLPASLAGLVSRQGMVLRRDPDFLQDMERLVQSLEAYGLSEFTAKRTDELAFGDLGLS
jgi:hypothetical protein